MYRTMLATALVVLFGMDLRYVRAGGLQGQMFNLPRGATLDPIPDDESVQVRITKFGTNEAIVPLDARGQSFSAGRVGPDGRVTFTGPAYSFTLPPSSQTVGRQAITLQFFRRDAQNAAALETQRLTAIIVSDDPTSVGLLDVSVPLPRDMRTTCEANPCCYYPRKVCCLKHWCRR